ncbi:MAG: MFS transporter, partial [Candidatus Bathyarchaeia archaeon]
MATAQVTSGLVDSFILEALARLLLGVGIGLAIVCVIKAIAEWFPSKELAMAESVQATGWAVGNAVGLAAAIPLSLALGMGWRGTFLAFGIFSVGFVVLFWVLAKERRPSASGLDRHKTDLVGGVLDMLKIRELWIITFGMAGAFSGSSIVMTWLPKSLIDAGWGEASASLLATVVPMVGIPANLAGGGDLR